MSSAAVHLPESPARRGRFAGYAATAARLLLGLVFAVFGLNGFVNFIPPPAKPMPAGAAAFLTALFATGYMIRLVAGTQLVAGVLLLANRFVPLALLLLAPVIVNIVAFHLFLAPDGLPLAAIVLVFEVALMWTVRAAYRPLLSVRSP